MAKLSSNNQLMVSVFNNIWDTDNENLTKNCDVKTILDIIRTGDYGVAEKINAIRNAVTKEQRDELKKHLFVITWQGIFSHKNNNGCVSLSSLVCIDIDHQSDRIWWASNRLFLAGRMCWHSSRAPAVTG